MSEPTVIRLTQQDAKAIVSEEKQKKKRKALLAIALMVLGTLMLATGVGFLVGTIWASCAIIGLVVLTIGVLLGTNG